MDTLSEIRRKMDSGNTILIASATDNLVNIIRSKIKRTRTDMTNIPEMLLLQEYCCHQNPIICTTTFRALCAFMTTNSYHNQLLIDWFVVLNPQTKCKIGFIQEIFELIVNWLKNDKNINNEHIKILIDLLIKIMDENLDEWRVILFHMKINTNFDDHEFIKNWLNVTKSLFKFIFMSRTPTNYRSSFVKLFAEILSCASDYDLLFEIYSWLQTDNLDDILFLSNFLEEFCSVIPNTLHDIKYNLCLCVTQTSIQLVSHGYDPTYLLQCLNSLLKICPCATDIVVLSISRTLSLCSSKFLQKIINFCFTIIKNYGSHKIIAQTAVASILQWNRTNVILDDTMDSFLSFVNSDVITTRSCTKSHKLSPFLTADSYITISYTLIKMCPEFDDKQFFSKWLLEINQINDLLNDAQFNFYLAGLYLCKIGDRSQQQILLKLLNKKYLMPLIAYAIDRETNFYNRFDLIKVIPTAACIQENMSLIINFIRRFENSDKDSLNILSIDMYYDLYMTETRCYRFLLYCLSKDKPSWQWNVVKSHTIKKMVETNPNSDLATVLKQVLEFYIKRSMYLPMKLTLESIVDLCLTEYLNPETMLKVIDKNVSNIHHPSIIPSYCNLLAVSANQTTENGKRHEFLQKLWSMVLHSKDDTVKCALKSLSNVDLENMPLNVLPEKFHSFPKITTELEDLEKVDLFNGPIPGECWIKFLQNINKSFTNEAQLMLSVWLRQELKKNVIPRVHSDHEPKNLKHLCNYSIARGFMSFIVPKRKKTLDTDEDTKVACLAIINTADELMYPFDWCFLEKHIEEGPNSKLWKESVILIAKQSTKSTSAFRLLHKCYKHNSSFNMNEIKLLFTTLFKMSNIIYHILQKQFVTDTVNGILNNIYKTLNNNNSDVELLCHILSEFKQILQNSETPIENINFVCDILENIWCTIHLDNKEILYAFLDCCLATPVEIFNNLRPYPVQESMLPKFIILSCTQNFITSNLSFDGFNKSIEACNQFAKENDYFNDLVIEMFKLDIFIPHRREFMANFMIYLASFTKKPNSLSSFNVLCTTFINIVIILSGYDIISFTDDRKLNYVVFPRALETFAKNSSQSARVIEWLKTMRTIKSLPKELSKLFYCCLAAFKTDKCLLEWTNRKNIILH